MSEDKSNNDFKEKVIGALVLLFIWQGVGWYKDWSFTPISVVKSFMYEPTPEELAERERVREAKKAEREKKKEEEKIKLKDELLAELRRGVSAKYFDFKNLAKIHTTETELQNEQTEKELKGKYIRISGQVSEIDARGDEYGIKKYVVQIYEPSLFATAVCYARSPSEENKIASAKVGSYLTISGKVSSYGDVLGLQISDCIVSF